MSLKSSLKGLWGETIVNVTCWLFLSRYTYYRMNNVTLPLPDGGTTQIDHIIVSNFGIFVIETKNYQGLISGNVQQVQWTQSFPNRQEFQFQNPLRQNYLHIKTLSTLLKLAQSDFHSMIIFVGNCEFEVKEDFPANVMRRGWLKYIKSKKAIILTDIQVERVIGQIASKKLKKSWQTDAKHKQYVKEKIAKKNAEALAENILEDGVSLEQRVYCPECQSLMVKRMATTGSNKGQVFWGCAQFPICRCTRNYLDR